MCFSSRVKFRLPKGIFQGNHFKKPGKKPSISLKLSVGIFPHTPDYQLHIFHNLIIPFSPK